MHEQALGGKEYREGARDVKESLIRTRALPRVSSSSRTVSLKRARNQKNNKRRRRKRISPREEEAPEKLSSPGKKRAGQEER